MGAWRGQAPFPGGTEFPRWAAASVSGRVPGGGAASRGIRIGLLVPASWLCSLEVGGAGPSLRVGGLPSAHWGWVPDLTPLAIPASEPLC